MPFMDNGTLLINPEAAAAWQAILDEERRKREEQVGQPSAEQPSPVTPGMPSPPTGVSDGTFTPTAPRMQKRFYASIDLEPHGIKMRFADIADNIIQHLAERPDTNVTISIEIQAESKVNLSAMIFLTLKPILRNIEIGRAHA